MRRAPAVVHLAGEPWEQGRQHAAAIPPEARRHVLALIGRARPGPLVDELLAAVRSSAPELVETVAGLASGLRLPFERVWAYVAGGYVSDVAEAGCSVAARAGQGPLLAKNRDFLLTHRPLQALIAVQPTRGYPWLSVGSLGSPGVYSSGMNSAGLAVADTHVRTWDIGPGVPRFSLMQQVLERYADVPGAVAHLCRTPRIGAGTVTLADAEGRVACVELSHTRAAVRLPGRRAWLVVTNHFRHPRLCRLHCGGGGDNGDEATSRARAARLQRARPATSAAAALRLLSSHSRSPGCLCRHIYGLDSGRATLSAVAYEPARRGALVRLGQPCQADTWQATWTGSRWTVGAPASMGANSIRPPTG